MNTLIERFLSYVAIDTQSDHRSTSSPSTEKQKNLSRLLVKELAEMGVNAVLDDHGYVYAMIEGNMKNASSIGFIAHVDTSPDAPGENVKPRIIKAYDGSPVRLNDALVMDPLHFPSLKRVIGDDIIVTDGNTLLGADDKCGVAEIMELVHHVTSHPDEPHGDIHICFTPDEEIGHGTDHFDFDRFKADFAYTSDGSEVGGIDYENFNAATAVVRLTGQSIHPGTAKNKLVNALHIAMEFHGMLPVFLDPAATENREGFNHLTDLRGAVEEATATYIIRNHDKARFEEQKSRFLSIRDYLNGLYGYQAVKVDVHDTYYNMFEILKDRMDIIELAENAIRDAGLEPFSEPIRGGTDGARLTFDGLPCPNLGTGGYQFHGRYEFASVQQMEKAVDILKNIVRRAAGETSR
jgi:tripeptide aminopeptidase